MVHPLVLDSFSSINLAIQGEVVLREGPLQQIEIHAQQVALEVLNKEVVEGEWVITFSRQLTNYDSVLIIITLPVWERLSVSGRGTIRTETPFTHLQSIRLVAGGTGRICVGGKAETGKINIAGSGWIDARDLAVQQAKVSIAGNGEAFLQVQKLLEVSIVGSGRVTYRGMPEVRANVMGAGVVQMEGSSNN
ncbi:MAG: DUF2807 domain-containing protein [Lewinellaceae bacterium]|nr:DUF2807 domain-containing protein [Lewinellaceae bacterium]